MIRFPLTDWLNQQESYNFLLNILHLQGLCGPYGHFLPAAPCPPMCDRAPILDYRCRECGTVFNISTGIVWAGTHYSCAKIMLILRGFTQGIPTLQLADELQCDYGTLINYRHQIQAAALRNLDRSPLVDTVTEGDEMFQNAGEKGDLH